MYIELISRHEPSFLSLAQKLYFSISPSTLSLRSDGVWWLHNYFHLFHRYFLTLRRRPLLGSIKEPRKATFFWPTCFGRAFSLSSLAFFFSLSHLYMCSALGSVRWVFYLESSQSPIEMNEKQKKQKTCFRAAWMNGCDAMWASCLVSHTRYTMHMHSLSRARVDFCFQSLQCIFRMWVCEFYERCTVWEPQTFYPTVNVCCLLFHSPPSSSRRPGVTNETTKKGD